MAILFGKLRLFYSVIYDNFVRQVEITKNNPTPLLLHPYYTSSHLRGYTRDRRGGISGCR